jgi:hypothetical protein
VLARRAEVIFVNPFERGEIGPDLFRAACQMGLEGWCPIVVTGLSRRSVNTLDQGEEPESPREGRG